MNYTNIADLINSKVNFESLPNYSHWNKCFCEVCGDGSHSKGPRGGWFYSGDMAFYRCFNCGIKGSFDPNRDFPICRNMRKIFTSFDIDIKDAMSFAHQNKFNNDDDDASKKNKDSVVKPYVNLYIKSHEMPDYFYPLVAESSANEIADNARKFLWDNYRLKDTSYPFYLSNGITKSTDPKEKFIAKALMNRIIIPFFRNNELIYYQGRAISNTSSDRYLNMNVPKTNILFNIDSLYKDFDRPLYIFEGAFDAIHVDGVATMENNLSSSQIELLKRCSRKKVIVPDISPNKSKIKENKLLEIGVYQQGWGIAVPELGTGSKDLCEGIKRYGKIFILKSLIDNTFFGNEAKMRADMLNY